MSFSNFFAKSCAEVLITTYVLLFSRPIKKKRKKNMPLDFRNSLFCCQGGKYPDVFDLRVFVEDLDAFLVVNASYSTNVDVVVVFPR